MLRTTMDCAATRTTTDEAVTSNQRNRTGFMPTLQEWCNGVDSSGNTLDPKKVQQYRALQKLPPLEGKAFAGTMHIPPQNQNNAFSGGSDHKLVQTLSKHRRRNRDYGEGCPYRGPLIETRVCKSCSSPGPLRVFQCSMHERCSERSPAVNSVSCETCDHSPFKQAFEPESSIDLRHLLPVAVVITAHNHAAQGWLKQAIESVLSQTVRVSEVIVVDDASEDDCAGVCANYADKVRYLRVEHRNTHATRMAGLKATHAQLVCFLDADDWLEPDYIDQAVRVVETYPQVGIVYTDVMKHEVDGSTVRVRYNETEVERENYMHSGSLFRREALFATGVQDEAIQQAALEDWYLWKRILRNGWRAIKSPAIYNYRQHADSKMKTVHNQASYRVRANLDAERVTVAIVLSGRYMWWERLRQWLEKQTWPKRQVCVHLVVNAHKSHAWHRELAADVVEAGYTDFRVQCDPSSEPLGRNVADMDRYDHEVYRSVQDIVPRLYSHVVRAADTEYLLTIEDDVLPPLDAITRMLDSMSEKVAAVTGVLPGRYKDQGHLCWKDGHGTYTTITAIGKGVEQIAGAGFGCCLHRVSTLKQIPLHAGPPTGNFDQAYFDVVMTMNQTLLIDWSIQCLHQNLTC